MKEYYFNKIPSKEEVESRIINDQISNGVVIDFYRKIERPKLNSKEFVLLLTLPLLIVISLFSISYKSYILIFSSYLFNFIFLVFWLKYYFLVLIKMYQAYAPDGIRRKCRFIPSCSEYTYISISRYGLIKGVLRGIKRIKRCNPLNGGIDNP